MMMMDDDMSLEDLLASVAATEDLDCGDEEAPAAVAECEAAEEMSGIKLAQEIAAMKVSNRHHGGAVDAGAGEL